MILLRTTGVLLISCLERVNSVNVVIRLRNRQSRNQSSMPDKGRDFCKAYREALGPTKLPTKWGPVALRIKQRVQN